LLAACGREIARRAIRTIAFSQTAVAPGSRDPPRTCDICQSFVLSIGFNIAILRCQIANVARAMPPSPPLSGHPTNGPKHTLQKPADKADLLIAHHFGRPAR
jgi:hypothetical protein